MKWKRMTSACLAFVMTFGLLPVAARAQTLVPPTNTSTIARRPKIGLALSGGGARGFAHIGVLEWIEQHRIPIDYVAGTSMGGLIGALYAMGMTPAEMRDFAEKIDWDKVLSGAPSYDELSFRRKEDRRTYPTDFELGVKGGLRVPVGVNPGHQINLIFDRMALPYSTITDFEDLPIPFACVATDMVAAEPVILKSGSLANALRATMAIPGVFTPLEINGRVLADGGLLNNIPVDVVKAMGADVVIAINVGTPLGQRENIETLTGMLSQVISVTTIQNDRRSLQLADYVITPQLGSYTLGDFKASAALADLGLRSANEQASPLLKFQLDDAQWQEHLAARRARRRTETPSPIAVEVAGVDGLAAQEIKHDLQAEVGQTVEPQRLERRLSEVRGGGRYESVGYDIVQLDREPRLRIQAKEKSYGPPLITPVIQMQSTEANEVDLAAGFRLTNFDVGGYGSELRTDVILGSRSLFAIEYYRPIGRKGFFLAPRAYYASERVDLYLSEDKVGQYRTRRGGAAIDAGIIFGRRSQLRVGYEIGRAHANVDIGSPLLPDVTGPFSSGSARFVFDSQDSAIVPTRGVRFTADSYWYFKSPGAPQGFPKSSIGGSLFKTVSRPGLVFGFGGAGTTFDREPGPLEQFTLGGPLRLSAYGSDEFRGNAYVLVGGGYLHRVGYLPNLLGRKIYAGAWYEGGQTFFHRSDANYRNDVAGGLIVETLLGPATIGGAWGEGGRGKFFFSFGRFF
jgi:NTE family protein